MIGNRRAEQLVISDAELIDDMLRKARKSGLGALGSGAELVLLATSVSGDRPSALRG